LSKSKLRATNVRLLLPAGAGALDDDEPDDPAAAGAGVGKTSFRESFPEKWIEPTITPENTRARGTREKTKICQVLNNA
jgi:hypothetical protein